MEAFMWWIVIGIVGLATGVGGVVAFRGGRR